jgi:hypothetical protein
MRTHLIRGGLLALALGFSGSAAAAGFNYNYVEGGFGEIDDGEVLFANFGYDIQKNFGLAGGLYIGDTDPGFDVTALEFGGVYHQPLKSNLDFTASLKVLHVEVEGDFFHPVWGNWSADADDTGLIASAGLRFQVQPKLQLEGDLKLSSNDMIDDGLGAQAAIRYYMTPKVSVAGGLAIDTELDGLFVSLRGDF